MSRKYTVMVPVEVTVYEDDRRGQGQAVQVFRDMQDGGCTGVSCGRYSWTVRLDKVRLRDVKRSAQSEKSNAAD